MKHLSEVILPSGSTISMADVEEFQEIEVKAALGVQIEQLQRELGVLDRSNIHLTKELEKSRAESRRLQEALLRLTVPHEGR